MAYQITIAGNVETSRPELLTAGAKVRVRIYANTAQMRANGNGLLSDVTGTVTETEMDEDYMEVTMMSDAGKRHSFAVKPAGSHDDRIIQAA